MEKNFLKKIMVIDKYNERARKVNSLLCVGLDSELEKIPEKFRELEFPQFEFNKYIIGETHEFSAAFKLNSAFYEARGGQGIRELKMTMDYLNSNHPDIFTILDAKRADIGNTNNGYATFAFDWLGCDAITLHPYFGEEALIPFLDRADKGCIILCRTSNLGASELQDLEVADSADTDVGHLEVISLPRRRISGNSGNKKIWEILAGRVSEVWNKNNNCMLVVGATYPEEMKKIREVAGDMTFLVPGIGAQGGDLRSVLEAGLNSQGLGLIISASRGIIFSENPKEEARKLHKEITEYKKYP